MGSPMAITAIQALGCFIGTGLWTACLQNRESLLSSKPWTALTRWMPAALAFVAYQLVNHEVSYACSLSERVVFMNLTPVITFMLEMVIMPPHLRSKGTPVIWAS